MLEKIFNTSKAIRIYVSAIFLIAIGIFIFANSAYSAENNLSSKNYTISANNFRTNAENLSLINKYQKKYFKIAKRNDMFLTWENTSVIMTDREELDKLRTEIQQQITNRYYLKKYKDIEKRYAICEAVSTIGMNEFAEKYYNEVDDLLNTVYKEIGSKIPPKDFQKLANSQKKWLKEVESYQKIYNTKDFGSVGILMYYDYKVDVSKFRVLLLMLYL